MSAVAAALARVSLPRIYALEAKHEFLRLIRAPAFAVPTLLFPPMFYVLFAILFVGPHANPGTNVYLLATYGVFGLMAPSLFGFGVSVALDRERGWLTLKRAQPMPPGAYLVSKLAMAMLFAALIFVILGVLATTLAGVRLPVGDWISLLAVEVFGTLPFCAIGLFIGTLATAQAAPAIVNLVYLPMSFLSAIWMPVDALPPTVRALTPLWPAFHLGQLALAAVGQPTVGSVIEHVFALAAVTLFFIFLARRRLARSA
jgi:ABC-2 type transport system permease protein